MHDAVGSLNRAIEHLGISKIEASLRWICFHSALTPDDAVILGASKPSQLQQNVEGISKGPLPDAAVAAINDIWRIVSRPE
jgi:aflatoxin B1 aldehyde reductase